MYPRMPSKDPHSIPRWPAVQWRMSSTPLRISITTYNTISSRPSINMQIQPYNLPPANVHAPVEHPNSCSSSSKCNFPRNFSSRQISLQMQLPKMPIEDYIRIKIALMQLLLFIARLVAAIAVLIPPPAIVPICHRNRSRKRHYLITPTRL